MKKKIVFMGTPIPLNDIDEYKTITYSPGDNLAQLELIKGLIDNYGEMVVMSEVSSLDEKHNFNIMGQNVVLLYNNKKDRLRYYMTSLVNSTKKLIGFLRKNKLEEIIVITRGAYVFNYIPIFVARLLGFRVLWVPFVVTSVEVPGESFPFNIISWLGRASAKKADGVIAYVEKTATDYMPGKPFIEIAYTLSEDSVKLYKESNVAKSKKFTIAYTGSLSEAYNFDYIIDTIKETRDKYRWVFAGDGVYGERIQELAEDEVYDVDYLGWVDNKQAIKLQKESHLLISPRLGSKSYVNNYYNQYAASGKLTEYICSGTPILASDVTSTNSDMRQFITPESGQSSTHIINDLEGIVKRYDEKTDLAKEGQEFALKHFTADYQNKKIYEFLESF